jgi:hypothetical protein
MIPEVHPGSFYPVELSHPLFTNDEYFLRRVFLLRIV